MSISPILPARYQASRLLGEGATGSVYLAMDTELGIEVALKVVHANLALHRRFRARFAREVALSSQVVHRCVIPVHDFGRQEDGRPFVSLAYARRGSLAELLGARSQGSSGTSLDSFVRIVDQVLDALGCLHARGLLHQDLKPGNVLLHGDEGTPFDVWVADLGVAGALSELTMNPRGIAGTPHWMAPEQLMCRPQELGPWTDLYPVGLLLYEALGAPPSDTVNGRVKQLAGICSGKAPVPQGTSRAIWEVVSCLLHPDPRQRYDRAADARRALAQALEKKPVEGTVTGLSEGGRSTHLSVVDLNDVSARSTRGMAPWKPCEESAVPRWNQLPRATLPVEPERESAADYPASLKVTVMRQPPLVVREGLRRQLWSQARDVVRSGEPRVVLLCGASGSGKTRTVESVVQALEQGGYMESAFLRYHDPMGSYDGYRGVLFELLSPWQDERSQVESRLARWLARDRSRTPEQMRSEAAVLTRWCGYLRTDEKPVNGAVGLAYLYRHMAARA
ncbi:MAG: serine/threonine-protein kinase, partial [Myxococcota bacterium]|nr:serine/threonine-protein kinase [Myxococcota bacterium]